ncbi:hypothetical protein BLNAU_14562 [Blattamonas nauphoetae]|uniref:Uncharacterized protein n=1 Tax=Blattamonas nauphoetae TaxID=2049346 RepID=A0ABQ9XG98_9EUKA|nr:hypothetical protein BLNAU_14562 [Blattamonas nauphoetae]
MAFMFPSLASISISVISTSHQATSCGIVQPLVSLSSSNFQTSPTGQEQEIIAGGVSVSGIGLHLENRAFAHSSGPLFSFQTVPPKTDTNLGPIRTFLSHTTLTNVTTTPHRSHFVNLASMTQTVSGCDVDECTNHFSGTAVHEINFGGSTLSTNSSFANCHSTTLLASPHPSKTIPNADVEYTDEDYENSVGQIRSPITSAEDRVIVVRCTFGDMASQFGAAIYIFSDTVQLSVSSSSFARCRASYGSDGDGGAVQVAHSSIAPDHPGVSSIDKCCFSDCSATDAGGSVSLCKNKKQVTDSYFEESSAKRGGGLFFEDAQCTLSNSSFIACHAGRGGATFFSYWQTAMYSMSLSVSSVSFRDCYATENIDSRDFFTSPAITDILTTDEMKDCDSSSGLNNTWSVYLNKPYDRSLIPLVEKGTTIVGKSVTVTDNVATIEVETEKKMSGTMAVLLRGPKVPRLVFIEFADSTIGSGTETVGAGQILPAGTDFEVKTVVMPGWTFDNFVFGGSSTLLDVNTTELTLNGVGLQEGNYWMLIRDGSSSSSDIEVSLTLSGTTTLTGTAPLYPSTATDLVLWETKYRVMEVGRESNGEKRTIVVNSPVEFTTPVEPARIEEAMCSLNGRKDEVIVRLVGRQLSDGNHLVSLRHSGLAVSVTSAIFDVHKTSCFVKFFVGWEENTTHLEYGADYHIVSVTNGTSSFDTSAQPLLEVPRPPLISSIVVPSSVSSSSFVFAVSGSDLPSGKTYLVSLTSGPSFSLPFSSSTEGSSILPIGGSNDLKFGTSYTISSVILVEEGKDDEHVLLSQSSFTTPSGPTLSLISCDLAPSDPNSVILSLTTLLMPSETFTLRLSSTSTPSKTVDLPIEFTSAESGTATVEVYNTSDSLEYGCSYSIVEMWSENVVAVVKAPVFSLPPSPVRIEGASCSLGGEKNKSAIVVLSGVNLGGGKAFSLTLQKMIGSTPSSPDIYLRGTLTGDASSTTHSHCELIFGESSPLLSFETTYLVLDLAIESSITVVNSGVNFTVPSEPSRLTELNEDAKYGSNDKTIEISFSGICLDGEYEVRFSVNGSETATVALNLIFDSNSKGKLKGTLFDTRSPSLVDLSYNSTYSVIGVRFGSTPILFEDGLSFKTIAKPSRLVRIEASDFVDSLKTTITLSFSSVALPIKSTVTLTFESEDLDATSSDDRVLGMETDEKGELKALSVKLYPFETDSLKKSSQLKFGRKYRIQSLRTASSGLIHFEEEETRFRTPSEPSRIEAAHHSLNAEEDRIVLTLEGRAMKDGAWTMTLSAFPGSPFTGKFISDTTISFELSLSRSDTPHLLFNKQYTITSVRHDGISIVIQQPLSFTTPKSTAHSDIIVSKHNGSEEPECGTIQSPCASIKTGWDHAGSGEETDIIQMKIDREASCRGWISVGRRALEMRCLWNRKDRLVVEDTVEGSRSTQAVFVVDGGHIRISNIVVLLPSFALSFSSLHPRFLIGGWGDCVVSSVRLSSCEGEDVGMGLVCMTRGTCTIDSVSLDHFTFSDSVTLISTCANNSEFHLALSHFVSSTVTSQNASLIAFASKNGLSGFSMTDSDLLWTVQKVGSSPNTALIDVSTPQTHVEIVRCTFFESGCVSERSIRLGWTLSIVLVRTEPLARRSVVDLLSCLVIDCCGLDSSSQNGAVVVDCGEGVTRLNLCGSWFEETTATSPSFERDGDGRLVLSKNRKIVYSASESAGAVVVANRIVPTIRRTGSAFSNCRLVLKNKL